MQYLHASSLYSLCAVHVACTNRRTARSRKANRQLHSGINWKAIYLYVSMVHFKPLRISHSAYRRMLKCLMNANWLYCIMKRSWHNSSYYLGIRLEGPKKSIKTSVRMVGIPVWLRTGRLLNTSHKGRRFCQVAQKWNSKKAQCRAAP